MKGRIAADWRHHCAAISGRELGSGWRGTRQVRDLQPSRRPGLPGAAERRSLRARRELLAVGETLLRGQGALF